MMPLAPMLLAPTATYSPLPNATPKSDPVSPGFFVDQSTPLVETVMTPLAPTATNFPGTDRIDNRFSVVSALPSSQLIESDDLSTVPASPTATNWPLPK